MPVAAPHPRVHSDSVSAEGKKQCGDELKEYSQTVSYALCNRCQKQKMRFRDFPITMRGAGTWRCPSALLSFFPEGHVPLCGPDAIRLCHTCVTFKSDVIQGVGGSAPWGQPSYEADEADTVRQWAE